MNVLKIGGGAGIDHGAALENIAERVARGERWVIVHGCSDAATTLGQQLGHPPQMITSPGGHTSRYNDARTIEIFSQAASTINQEIGSTLSGMGLSAAGLVGHVISGERKKAIRAIRNGRQVIIRDDYSGKITGVDTGALAELLETDVVPVVAPLATGEEGENLNVDGDLAAANIARALSAERLVILSNVPGLLRDVEDQNSLIGEFSLDEVGRYESYAEGRMKKKLMAAQEAGAEEVILADARVANPVDYALNGGGTHIYRHRQPQMAEG